MLRVDLRDHHGHIRRPAVGAVVGNHRRLGLRVSLLDGADFFLGHVHGAEHEVHARGHLLHLVHVHHHQLFHSLGHRSGHFPAAAHRLLIGLSGGTGAGGYRHHLVPGMILQQGEKALTHHARGAQNSNSQFLFHNICSPHCPIFPPESPLSYGTAANLSLSYTKLRKKSRFIREKNTFVRPSQTHTQFCVRNRHFSPGTRPGLRLQPHLTALSVALGHLQPVHMDLLALVNHHRVLPQQVQRL